MKNWIFRVLVVITSVALVVGIADSQGMLRLQGYLQYHLYNTALGFLVQRTDITLVFALIGCLVWAALRLRRSIKGFWGIPVSIGIAAGILYASTYIPVVRPYVVSMGASAKAFGAAFARSGNDLASSHNWALMRIFLREGFLPVAGILGAALALSILCRKESKEDKASASKRRVFRGFGRWSNRAFSFVLIVFGISFIVLHMVYGVVHARTMAALKNKPNVVFIVVDSLRTDHLGCYGYGRNTSPNIDNLAKEAMRFTGAYSQAPWTLWSVASFMTSRYPESLGMPTTEIPGPPKASIWGRLSERYLTLAETLADEGYKTSSVTSNGFVSHETNTAQGLNKLISLLASHSKYSSSPQMTASAEKWIKNNKSRPFFMYLHYNDVHDAYIKHPQFDFSSKSYHGKYDKLCFINNNWETGMYIASHPQELHQALALYDSEIAYTDDSIGRLLSCLKEQGLYDNTLIILSADHGEGFGDHLIDGVHPLFDHSVTLYNELVHVPLVIKLPGRKEGRVISGTFPLVNLFPSIVETVGGDVHASLCGQARDLSKLDDKVVDTVFSATDEWKDMRTIINYPYKYTLTLENKTGQLYNIATDPGEKHDLSKTKPRIAKALSDKLAKHMEETRLQNNPNPEAARFTEEEKRALKALGYL